MGLFDIFTFKKESKKIFTKENFQIVLNCAKEEIIKQVKNKLPGKEKMAIVEKAVISKIWELQNNTSNSVIKWLLDLLILVVPVVTQFIYDTLKIVSALPGVKLLDKLAGMLFGIIEVTLVIWLIFIIMSLFDLYGLNTWLEQQVYDNIILTYLYNNNYLVEIIRLILTLKPL